MMKMNFVDSVGCLLFIFVKVPRYYEVPQFEPHNFTALNKNGDDKNKCG